MVYAVVKYRMTEKKMKMVSGIKVSEKTEKIGKIEGRAGIENEIKTDTARKTVIETGAKTGEKMETEKKTENDVIGTGKRVGIEAMTRIGKRIEKGER